REPSDSPHWRRSRLGAARRSCVRVSKGARRRARPRSRYGSCNPARPRVRPRRGAPSYLCRWTCCRLLAIAGIGRLKMTAPAPPPAEVAAEPLVDAPAKLRSRRRLGLRTALTALVLLTVAVTALLIHLTWFYAAKRNVGDVVGQLNRQIVDSIQHE